MFVLDVIYSSTIVSKLWLALKNIHLILSFRDCFSLSEAIFF